MNDTVAPQFDAHSKQVPPIPGLQMNDVFNDAGGYATSGAFGSAGAAPLPPLPPSFSESGYYKWVPTPQKFRQRHPALFWGSILLVLFLIMRVGAGIVTEMTAGMKLAEVSIEGTIMNSTSIIAWISTIEDDTSIKGVLVRVDSPGGAVGPSQEIYLALKRLAAKKPMVVSMGSLAASGGYYVSAPAKYIFAVPSTITGSIGVRMDIPNLESLLRTLGVASTTLKSGELKDAGSIARTMTEAEKSYLQGMVNDMYDDFIEVVRTHRGLSDDQVRAIADGRAITGRQAVALGLVDQIGDRAAAIAHLKTLCGLKEKDKVTVVVQPIEAEGLLKQLVTSTVQTVIEQRAAIQAPAFFYQ